MPLIANNGLKAVNRFIIFASFVYGRARFFSHVPFRLQLCRNISLLVKTVLWFENESQMKSIKWVIRYCQYLIILFLSYYSLKLGTLNIFNYHLNCDVNFYWNIYWKCRFNNLLKWVIKMYYWKTSLNLYYSGNSFGHWWLIVNILPLNHIIHTICIIFIVSILALSSDIGYVWVT